MGRSCDTCKAHGVCQITPLIDKQLSMLGPIEERGLYGKVLWFCGIKDEHDVPLHEGLGSAIKREIATYCQAYSPRD